MPPRRVKVTATVCRPSSGSSTTSTSQNRGGGRVRAQQTRSRSGRKRRVHDGLEVVVDTGSNDDSAVQQQAEEEHVDRMEEEDVGGLILSPDEEEHDDHSLQYEANGDMTSAAALTTISVQQQVALTLRSTPADVRCNKSREVAVQVVSDVPTQERPLTQTASTNGNEDLSSRVNVALMLLEDVKHGLECPVCCKISLPPVMQCRNGHVTCNSCRNKVRSCPMCREVNIDVRNLYAERGLAYVTIPCDFSSYGCTVETLFRDKDMHIRHCKHRPYNCPYIECDHKLAATDVVPHVSTAHRDDCRNSDGPEITASMILIGNCFGGDGAWSPRVITCFGRIFFDVALTRDRWLHHWVWLLGEEEEVEDFFYEITAFKGNVRYSYSDVVASLRTSDDDIVTTGRCLSISDPIGKRLRDGDKIRYKLKLARKVSSDVIFSASSPR